MRLLSCHFPRAVISADVGAGGGEGEAGEGSLVGVAEVGEEGRRKVTH
jgi:hypothetical protein